MGKDVSTECFGIGRDIMNSLALYVYYQIKEEDTDVIAAFNGWSAWSKTKVTDPGICAAVLEHLRKLMKTNRQDLGRALEMDGFPVTERS